MSVRVCRFQSDAGAGWGFVEGGAILPVEANHIRDFFNGKFRTLEPAGPAIDIGAVRILCPFEYPTAVICQGQNYAEHIRESGGNAAKKHNIFFVKATSSLAPAVGKVKKPGFVQLLDYEAEIALVIARDIRGPVQVTEGNLSDYVAGVTLANDISARDIQIPQGQWFKGKSYRTFCPVGPYVSILERDDFASLAKCEFELSVNSRTRQSGRFSDMIFTPPQTLTELTGLMDLHAGDLVLTGTPSGVAIQTPPAIVRRITGLFLSETSIMNMFVRGQRKKPGYIKPGDRIEASLRSPDGVIDSGLMRLEIADE